MSQCVYYQQFLAKDSTLAMFHYISTLFKWCISIPISFILHTTFMDSLVADSEVQNTFTQMN